MLQAFARSSMRNHKNAVCGEVDVYIIDSEASIECILDETFPGASYRPWLRSKPKLTKRQVEIKRFLESAPSAYEPDGLLRKTVYTALKIEKSNFLKLLNEPAMLVEIGALGLCVTRDRFRPLSAP
ncbi:hypothetical protein [uncultured Sphingomonas sp.]|uniref:hypothetical protein n=1 Tax=uncultured Sphingomonas sp. TaxID=158754 RepID=UPI0025E196A9|nr:hypothetical protein [uncultured Sphingomonas sp.]